MKRFIILMSAIAILTLTSLGCGPTLTRYTVSEDGSVKVETIPSLSHPHYPTPGGDYDEMTGPPGMTREEMEGHVQAHLKQEAEKRREKEEKRRKEEENPFKGGGGGGGGH